VNNITTKHEGINFFGEDIDPQKGYCFDYNHFWRSCGCTDYPDGYCNFDEEKFSPTCERRITTETVGCTYKVQPFSTCKTDCPRVRSFGIIGGGAVLFTGAAFAGTQTLLPLLGFGAASFVGGGAAISRAMCIAPFCRCITLSDVTVL